MGKLVSNYLYTVVYQLLILITPFITTPYISRVLKPEGIGIDAYVLSVVQLFVVFVVLSFPMYGSKQIATKQSLEERSKEFWSIYTVQLISSFITIIIYSSYILNVEEYKILFILHIFTLLSSTIDVSWYFIGKEQIKSVTTRNIIVRIVSILLIFTLVKDVDDLNKYIMINAFTIFFGQLVMWIPLIKEISFVRISFYDIRRHILPIISLFLPQVMIQIYILVNKVVLGRVAGEVEVGFYNQADKIIRIALGFITSLGSVLLPRMAMEYSKGNIESMKKYIKYAIQFVLMITLPMSLGLMGIAPQFIPWFLGNDYDPVIHLLMIMSPVILFVGLANIFGVQILIATNQQNKYGISITIGAVLSLITNILLVRHMASAATTWSLLIAEATGALIQMYFVRKYFDLMNFMVMFLKYLTLSVMIFLVVRIVGNYVHLHSFLITFLQLIVGGCIYFIGLIIIKDSILFKILNSLRAKMSKS